MGGDLYLSTLSITTVALNKLPTNRETLMVDDAYWLVPDGLDYHREIELRHNCWGHIIQPFTSLSIIHLSSLSPALGACSYETQLDLFAMRAEWSGADRDMIISLLMAAGKIKATDDWLSQQFLSHIISQQRSQCGLL